MVENIKFIPLKVFFGSFRNTSGHSPVFTFIYTPTVVFCTFSYVGSFEFGSALFITSVGVTSAYTVGAYGAGLRTLMLFPGSSDSGISS